MLNEPTMGGNMEQDENDQTSNIAHIITMAANMSVLGFMKASSKHLKGAREIMKSRKLDADMKAKTVKQYLALWDEEHTQMIEKLEQEIAALDALRHLAHIDPLTATRH